MMHDKKRVITVLRDEFVDVMCKIDVKYKNFFRIINGKTVLYLKVLRTIYGCIEIALLWYELFTTTLHGFCNLSFTTNVSQNMDQRQAMYHCMVYGQC